jgi:hypothetical protein
MKKKTPTDKEINETLHWVLLNKLLDEMGAPKQFGRCKLSPFGRLQRLRVKLTAENATLRAELAAARDEIEATKKGDCGHNWDRREWAGCPVCAMRDGIGDRATKAEAERDEWRKCANEFARAIQAEATWSERCQNALTEYAQRTALDVAKEDKP